jgi:hypothetical protein
VLAVELGRLGSVNYVRDLAAPSRRCCAAAIAIGLARAKAWRMPEEGVMANVQLGSFNVDAWEDALARVPGTEAARRRAPARRADAGAAWATCRRCWPCARRTSAPKGAPAQRGGGRLARRPRLARQRRCRRTERLLEYRQPQNTGAGRCHARLARLNIAASAASHVETCWNSSREHPGAGRGGRRFELKGRKLGRLEIDAINRGAGRWRAKAACASGA